MWAENTRVYWSQQSRDHHFRNEAHTRPLAAAIASFADLSSSVRDESALFPQLGQASTLGSLRIGLVSQFRLLQDTINVDDDTTWDDVD
jgi:hypothetical protein